MKARQDKHLNRALGTWHVLVAGVALVVASSTLVSDFTGYFALGGAFAVALVLGFIVNLLLGLSAAELAVAHPRAGALYDYARAVIGGRRGRFAGVFLGLALFGMFAFAASGETAAGAYGLQALLGSELPVEVFIVALIALAAIPNILGIRTAAGVSAGLLVLMLGIRWGFGVAGFLGLGATGAWKAPNLANGGETLAWFGDGGVVTAGLTLAFWSFVGIEFACSLAEEVREPRRTIPRGIVLGLFGILATSLVMGLGVTGTQTLDAWQAATAGSAGRGGDAPQLAVGTLMFGRAGFMLMALASVTATLGTLTVAFASMPRVLYSIARDGQFFGPLSRSFGRLHSRFGTPVAATAFTASVYSIPALISQAVIDWLYSAAYVWVLLYVVLHALALGNRFARPGAVRTLPAGALLGVTVGGIASALVTLCFAFAGHHLHYGPRVLLVLLLALGAATISHALSTHGRRSLRRPKRETALPAPSHSLISTSMSRKTLLETR